MSKSYTRFIIFFIIICIVAALARAGLKMLDEKKYVDLQTDLLLIQGKVKIIKGKADVNSDTTVYVGQKLSDSNNEKIKSLMRKIQIEDDRFDEYYVLENQDFENIGILHELKNKGNSLFLVNYEDGEVIYTKGIKVNGSVKYKLSDIIKMAEKKEWILHNRMLE